MLLGPRPSSCALLGAQSHMLQVVTVEGLGNSKAGFHPVQEAIATHHASQCGFCTPGFSVAIHAKLEACREAGRHATIEDLNQGLDGNLCRCTGYRPLVDACRVRTAARLSQAELRL